VDYGQGGGIPPSELARLEEDRALGVDELKFAELPDYAGTWEGLGLVVEELRERGWSLSLYGNEPNRERWECYLFREWRATSVCDATGATAPEAVARAALLALGGE
jgi:hypothetical protein